LEVVHESRDRRQNVNRTTIAVGNVGLGAVAMYLLDPRRGRRRRARLAEAASHVSHRAQAVAGMTARDVRHRVSGLAARMLDQLVEEGTPSNEVALSGMRAGAQRRSRLAAE
jgi:hypothetical protein